MQPLPSALQQGRLTRHCPATPSCQATHLWMARAVITTPCADTEQVSVGVVRNPTQTAGQEQTPLSSMVAKLPGERLGFTPEGSRLVVDEYLRRAQGDLILHRTSINICGSAELISLRVSVYLSLSK